MSVYGKGQGKLNTSKNAAVSLDSLLGILSSAYGTEGLDTKIVLDQDTVNLRNLSVDNIKAYTENMREVEKEESNKEEEENVKLNISIATSTTYLKSSRSIEDEKDLTLLSIMSSENMKLFLNKPNDSEDNLINVDDNVDLKQHDKKPSEPDFIDMEHWQTIGGFYVDDIEKQIVFDIQYSKKSINDVFPEFIIGEPDIIICVVDSTKEKKTKLEVPKRYLVSKMEYFADLDKEFGLENLNYIVKCKLSIFQWLIQWITADLAMCKPCLNLNNLTLILSIAHHLGVHKLVGECLDYFASDFHNIMKANHDIEYVIDDSLLPKLVERFSNTEIESICDDFVIFKDRMYCILITLLAERKPSPSMGHYASLANMFQCEFCGKFLTMKISDSLPCRSDRSLFSIKGELVYRHEVSSSWNLSKYIELMHEALKSWRAVYWRLWGLCHVLDCEVCGTCFPLSQTDWCVYHSQDVSYFPLNQMMSYPIGTYNCCGEITFMFDVLQRNSGCSFRPHQPRLSSKSKISAYKIYEKHKALISNPAIEKPAVKKFYRLLTNSSGLDSTQSAAPEPLWWQGFQLAPKEKRDYSLIPMSVLNKLRNKSPEKKISPVPKPLSYEIEVHLGSTPICPERLEFPDMVATGCKPKAKSKVSNANNTSSKSVSKKKKSGCLYVPEESLWQAADTNKNNQDTQRDFEEIAMRNLVKMLTPEDQGKNRTRIEPTSGTYVRIESDFWHEYYKHNNVPTSSTKQSSVINRTFPLSWFRKQPN